MINQDLGLINDLKKLKVGQLNDLQFLWVIGAATVEVQTLEYGMLGVISLLNETLLKDSKNFKKITPKVFFSNDKVDTQKRRKTLGEIIGFLKGDITAFDNDKLDILLKNRNEFVHNLYRNYLIDGRNKEAEWKYKAFQLSLELYEQSILWNSIFRGFLYEIILDIKTKRNLGDDYLLEHEPLKQHHASFLNALKTTE